MDTMRIDRLAERIERVGGFLAIDPLNRHLLAEMIDLQLDAGQFPAAEHWIENALTNYPDDPGFEMRSAASYIAQGRLSLAEEVLLTMSRRGVDDPWVEFNLAYVYCAQKRFQSALALLFEHPAVEQAIPAAVVLRARCLHHLGRVDEAYSILEPMLQEDSSHFDALGLAALLELDRERLAEASSLATRALTGDPGNVEAIVTHGYVALSGEDVSGAMDRFQAALVAKPTDGRSWLGLALCQMQRLDLEQATKSFSCAVQCMPTHSGTLIASGWCRLLANDLEGAEREFSKAMELDRNFAEAHGCAAVVAHMRGHVDEAKNAVARALRLDPNCGSALYAKALLSGEIHDFASFQKVVNKLMYAQIGR
jgi:Flp pilus assembly protein TadD